MVRQQYIVHYAVDGDAEAANIIYEALARIYGLTKEIVLISGLDCIIKVKADDPIPKIFSGYDAHIITVGGQAVNPFFKKLADANLINRITSEGQATIELEEKYRYGSDIFGFPLYAKRVYAVAGWDAPDTKRAASWIAINGLPSSSITVPSSAVIQQIVGQESIPVNNVPVGAKVDNTFTVTVDFAATPAINTESAIRAYIQANVGSIVSVADREIKSKTGGKVYVQSGVWGFYPDYFETLARKDYAKPVGYIRLQVVDTSVIPALPLIIVAALIAATATVVSLSWLGVTIVNNQTKQKVIDQAIETQDRIDAINKLYADGKITKSERDQMVGEMLKIQEKTSEAIMKSWGDRLIDMLPFIVAGIGVIAISYAILRRKR